MLLHRNSAEFFVYRLNFFLGILINAYYNQLTLIKYELSIDYLLINSGLWFMAQDSMPKAHGWGPSRAARLDPSIQALKRQHWPAAGLGPMRQEAVECRIWLLSEVCWIKRTQILSSIPQRHLSIPYRKLGTSYLKHQ